LFAGHGVLVDVDGGLPAWLLGYQVVLEAKPKQQQIFPLTRLCKATRHDDVILQQIMKIGKLILVAIGGSARPQASLLALTDNV
jgi:hypothetical protein